MTQVDPNTAQRPLLAWQKWVSAPNEKGHVTFATIHHFDYGVRFSYAEETDDGVFCGRDNLSPDEFRSRFPIWREDPPRGDDDAES